jgi:hypothetical protein
VTFGEPSKLRRLGINAFKDTKVGTVQIRVVRPSQVQCNDPGCPVVIELV